MKKLFFFAAIMMMAISANAQDGFGDDDGGNGFGKDKRKNVVSLGIKAEGNYSSMSKYKEVDLGLKSGIGYGGGLVIAARFGKRTQGSDPGTGLFGIQIEPGYVQHTIGTNSEDIKISYFEAPVLMKFYLTPTFNIEVGPNFCATLSSKPDYIYAENSRIATGDLKGFDVKACVGASFETKSGLYASLRYNMGMSDLAKNFKTKVSAISFTVGYKFNIFKF